MKIPQHKIDEIKQAADIVEVVGQYVNIRLRGRNHVGLCPFHNEKTPSFTVSADKQIFYCFGCHTGGDVIAFVREFEKLSYPEAIRFLAEKYAIEMPRETDMDPSKSSEVESLYFAYKMAARYYFEQLRGPAGKSAREYLSKRGFEDSTLKSFGVGYAPDLWEAFVAHAHEQSMDLTVLEKAGLIMKKSDGSHYDRFRHRVIFPIFNTTGRVIAFGGRQLREEQNMPKYVNSPESPIYHKSRTLYGLFQARDTVRKNDQLIVVEGYADCLMLHQHGLTQTVASSGTAFTLDQATLIKRYTQNVTLVYDGDSAGIHAAERGGAIMIQSGLQTKIVVLPASHDPDSFIRENGRDGFEEVLKQGRSYIDFRVEQWHRQKKLDTVHGRTQAARELIQIVGGIRDPIQSSYYAAEVSDKLRLDEKLVQQELQRVGKGRDSSSIELTTPAKKYIPREDSSPQHVLQAERGVLRNLLMKGSEQADLIFNHLRPEDFTNRAIQKVIQFIFTQWMMKEEFSSNTVLESFPEDIQKALTRLMLDDLLQYEIVDCLATIQYHQLQKRLAELRETMKNMSDLQEDAEHLEEASSQIIRQMHVLKTKKQLLTLGEQPVQERMELDDHHVPF